MSFIFLLVSIFLISVVAYDHNKNPTTSTWFRSKAEADGIPAVKNILDKVKPYSDKANISPLLAVVIAAFVLLLLLVIIF